MSSSLEVDYAAIKVPISLSTVPVVPDWFWQELHKTLPPFKPIIPVSLLPYLAYLLLTLTFGLAFYFST